MFQVASMWVLVAWAALGALAFLVGATRVKAARRAVEQTQFSTGREATVLTTLSGVGSTSTSADVNSTVPDLLAG